MWRVLSDELRSTLHNLEFLLELVDTFPRASELHTLRGAGTGDLTTIDAVLSDPPVKTSCADAEVFSNMSYRLTRKNKCDCTLPELSGILLGHRNEPFKREMNSILTDGKGNQPVGQVRMSPTPAADPFVDSATGMTRNVHPWH